MTDAIFYEDGYQQECEALVSALNDRGGILLDRTIFYPAGGGQPGDGGVIVTADGKEIEIATTVYESDRSAIVHVPTEGGDLPELGTKITCKLDWQKRFNHMRVHSALHLLCAALPYPVTGGQIGAGQGRLDFDIPEAGLDKDALAEKLNTFIVDDWPIRYRWITDEELDAQPDLVRTMKVKPPRGQGRVRLIEIEGVDLQPCGGTHVRSTAEIGEVQVTKVEKKGAQNRRVRIALVNPT